MIVVSLLLKVPLNVLSLSVVLRVLLDMLLIFCFVELELAGELVGELAVGPGVENAVGHAVDLLLC